MTVVSGKRRGRGEDSIYWDSAKDRYVGAVSLGYSASGTRIRKKVMGRTKTEVREKLRELHAQVDNGVRPRRHYAVGDALRASRSERPARSVSVLRAADDSHRLISCFPLYWWHGGQAHDGAGVLRAHRAG
jgi:hypothetical protein